MFSQACVKNSVRGACMAGGVHGGGGMCGGGHAWQRRVCGRRNGYCSGGTHPTGMHSYLNKCMITSCAVGAKCTVLYTCSKSKVWSQVGRCDTRSESEESVVQKRGGREVRELPWLWNPGQTSAESKAGVSVAPQKGLIIQTLKKQLFAEYKTTSLA